VSPLLPPGVRVDEVGRGVRYVLPHRRPVYKSREGALPAGCAIVSMTVGFGALAGYASILSDAGSDGIVHTVLKGAVTSPLAVLGVAAFMVGFWILYGGRSTITLTHRRLILREWIGPLFFWRSVRLERVRAFRAHSFTEGGRGALDVDLEGASQRRWAVEYPLDLLEALAAELTRCLDRLRTGASQRTEDVQFTADGVRLMIRPGGWTDHLRSTASAAASAAVLLLATTAWARSALETKDGRLAVPIVLAACWAGATIYSAAVFRRARRATILEYTAKSLRATDIDPLGRRIREWPRSEVWGFEVHSVKDARGNHGPAVLQVRLSNGGRPVLVGRREPQEFEWIASVLRRGRPKAKEVEVVATSTPGGTCQVCGTWMEERVVWCARCRTPHHRECWDYTGMCSTFGCREIRFESTAAPTLRIQ